MALYEKRLQQDLIHLQEQVREMGDRAETSLKNAVHAFLTGNEEIANQTVLSDHSINRKMREIDRISHGFIARHLPSGGHLRLVSSIIRLNIELERIGDYAVTISREGLQLKQPLEGALARETEIIATEAMRMLRQALTAFYDENAEAAKATMTMSSHMETTLDAIYASLMDEQHDAHIHDLFVLFAVLNQLKRVTDQAKNICEETVFSVTGETKALKVYNILFVDEDNASLSQMAEAIARKNHPKSGRYRSAGRRAAAAIDPALTALLEQYGMDLSRAVPETLGFSNQELAEFHVIVSLQGAAKSYFPSIPFHTVFLDWDISAAAAEVSDTEKTQYYEKAYRELSYQIKDLMEILRGEGAD